MAHLPKACVTALLLIAAALPVCRVKAAEGETLRIGVSQNDGGLGTIPFTIAQRQGYLVREGVNVELVRYGGPTLLGVLWNQYDGLAKGEVALIRSQAPFLIQKVMEGGDFVGIAANTTNPVHVLMARPDIGTFADLKGKTVAITYPNDAITIATRKLLSLHGIGPGDVTLKAIEGSQQRFECLLAGACAAVSVGQPTDFAAAARGYHRLGISNEAGPLMFGLDVVTNGWARAHEDLVVRYVRAMAAALRYANDPANDRDMLGIIMQTSKADAATARDILRFYRDPKYLVLSRQGEIDTDAFERTISLEVEYGALASPPPAASRFIDQRYLLAAGIR
jgi:ABC-type nitrate/sulfonate/bicarbonate transport system substrate-binding protein